MNYLKIVLDGFFNPATRDHLEAYFCREHAKAGKEGFGPREFFEGCNRITDGFRLDLSRQVGERVNLMGQAKLEAKEVRADGVDGVTFRVNLFHCTGGEYLGVLSMDDILYIEYHMLEAYQKVILEGLKSLEERLDAIIDSSFETKQEGPEKVKLSLPQIALKHYYEGLIITRKNGKEIAKSYGHSSGEKLYQWFSKYSSLANRKGDPGGQTAKPLLNKINLFESVIEYLPADKQERAKDEVSILKAIYEANYLQTL